MDLWSWLVLGPFLIFHGMNEKTWKLIPLLMHHSWTSRVDEVDHVLSAEAAVFTQFQQLNNNVFERTHSNNKLSIKVENKRGGVSGVWAGCGGGGTAPDWLAAAAARGCSPPAPQVIAPHPRRRPPHPHLESHISLIFDMCNPSVCSTLSKLLLEWNHCLDTNIAYAWKTRISVNYSFNRGAYSLGLVKLSWYLCSHLVIGTYQTYIKSYKIKKHLIKGLLIFFWTEKNT